MMDALRTMMAVGEVNALPAGVTWPVHRALVWLRDEAERMGEELPFIVTVRPDPDALTAVEGADDAIVALVDEGFLVQSGLGYTARRTVEVRGATAARRALLREDPATVTLLVHAGQRLETWASTALKNADTAAASWASAVTGPTPTVRQPALVALR